MPASSDGRMAQHGLGGYGGELDRWPGLDARVGQQTRLAQGALRLMPALSHSTISGVRVDFVLPLRSCLN